MTPERIQALLEAVRVGDVDVSTALDRLRLMPYEDLGFASVDHHRALRSDMPEVIYCASKTTEQTLAIARSLAHAGSAVLATRVPAETQAALAAAFPSARLAPIARAVWVPGDVAPPAGGRVTVLCAGTSDLPVSEEAALTAEVMGCEVRRVHDVGVAGLHRILAADSALRWADCLVVVAGMEGALASVVGGLTASPLIAVPTSVGYGASFGGLAAVLAMLNSCAAGVSVVNIDNGFGAGVAAARIARRAAGLIPRPDDSRRTAAGGREAVARGEAE